MNFTLTVLDDFNKNGKQAWKIQDHIACFSLNGITVYGPTEIKYDNHFVFRDGDEIVGKMHLMHHSFMRRYKPDAPHEAYVVKEVFIKPQYRNTGVITALYNYLIIVKGISIESDAIQTQGSKNIYRRLLNAGRHIQIIHENGSSETVNSIDDLENAYKERYSFLIVSK